MTLAHYNWKKAERNSKTLLVANGVLENGSYIRIVTIIVCLYVISKVKMHVTLRTNIIVLF